MFLKSKHPAEKNNLKNNLENNLKNDFPPLVLPGAHVHLRPPRPDDFYEWVTLRTKNKTYLTPYEPAWDDNYETPIFFAQRIRRQLRDWNADRAYSFLIFKNDTGAMIGGMNVNEVSRGAAQYASLGYWIDESHQGLGYMAETMRLIVGFCFERLHLNRVNAACLAHNLRSHNVLLRAGFVKEGFAESYIEINGSHQDHVLFGLTRTRWDDHNRKF
jgi:ribosomal-protein-alanine N-acetyltransferase